MIFSIFDFNYFEKLNIFSIIPIIFSIDIGLRKHPKNFSLNLPVVRGLPNNQIAQTCAGESSIGFRLKNRLGQRADGLVERGVVEHGRKIRETLLMRPLVEHGLKIAIRHQL